jgi:soluble lytic murein transglycosylase-like protein
MRGREFKKFSKLGFGLLSAAFVLGLVFPPLSFSEIYKYVDQDGVVHLSNVPDARHNLVLKEGWVRFRLGSNFKQYDPLIRKAAETYRVDYALVKAVIKAESNFNPSAVSRKGAKGLMQLTPETAGDLGVIDSFQPEDNIHGGVRYLRYLLDLFNGDLKLALAAYNAGENAVLRYNGIPPYKETKTYIQEVLRHLQNYRREANGSAFF